MKRIVLTLMAIVLVVFPLFSRIINIPGDQPSIQAGIDVATDGDTVLVADSTYYENINFKGKAITVASQFLMDGDTSHISKTIIDGSQPVHPDTASTVLMISGEDTTSVLCGFTITGGGGTLIEDEVSWPKEAQPFRCGGGILIFDAGGKIEHNIIRDIYIESTLGFWGGGIMILSANKCIESKNIIIQGNSILENKLVSETISAGAGIASWIDNTVAAVTTNIMIQNNLISRNIGTVPASGSDAFGGGIYIGFWVPTRDGEYIIRNNIISHNEVHQPKYTFGGGIYVNYFGSGDDPNPTPQLYNNIITDNYSQVTGGGIGIYSYGDLHQTGISPKPLIFNNTIVNNSSNRSPGLFSRYANPLLLNNIFWNNSNPENAELFGIKSDLIQNNIIRGYKDQTGGSNFNYDPMLTGGSFELSDGSPGIGSGTDSIEISSEWYFAPSLDFHGNPRPNPIDARIDIGAIESPYVGFVYILDTAFLYALIEGGVDVNKDSLISYAEAEAVKELYVAENGISDMTGIQAFVNLEILECWRNELMNLDVSKNNLLNILSCENNQLKSLDVSNNPVLIELSCDDNHIAGLDVSTNTLLSSLSCENNQLTILRISGCAALTNLICRTNHLTRLDVSNNTALKCLLCNDNLITSLDISHNAELNSLFCGNNLLASLDISNNLALGLNGCYANLLSINDMPSLYEVCVWETFSLDSVDVDSTGSPNLCFTNNCGSCPTGIEGNSQSRLSIYPNPSIDLLTIETDRAGYHSIEINSLNGQQILIGEMQGTSHQIDLSSFQKGVYFISIRSKDFVTTRKIIKL